MNIKLSTKLLVYLQKNIPEYRFILMQTSREYFDACADSKCDENAADYDPRHKIARLLQVNYPDNTAGCVKRYLTTRNLETIYRGCNGTEAGFIQALRKDLAISINKKEV